MLINYSGLVAWGPWFDCHLCQLLVVSLGANPTYNRSAAPTVVNTSVPRGTSTESVTLKVRSTNHLLKKHLGHFSKCRLNGFPSHPLRTSQACAFLTSPPNDPRPAHSVYDPSYLRPVWDYGAAVEEPSWTMLTQICRGTWLKPQNHEPHGAQGRRLLLGLSAGVTLVVGLRRVRKGLCRTDATSP